MCASLSGARDSVRSVDNPLTRVGSDLSLHQGVKPKISVSAASTKRSRSRQRVVFLMIPELGHFALVLAFFVCLASAGIAGVANLRRGVAMVEFTRNATVALFGLVLFAFVCLMIAFIKGDFSVLNVASNSNSLLPVQYRISATWGSHEGSMLLWVLMMSGFKRKYNIGMLCLDGDTI